MQGTLFDFVIPQHYFDFVVRQHYFDFVIRQLSSICHPFLRSCHPDVRKDLMLSAERKVGCASELRLIKKIARSAILLLSTAVVSLTYAAGTFLNFFF